MGCAEFGTSRTDRRAVTAKPWRSRSDQRGYYPYVAQATPPPDDEIAKKCRFRMGTSPHLKRRPGQRPVTGTASGPATIRAAALGPIILGQRHSTNG
jgi:hypothetical protein